MKASPRGLFKVGHRQGRLSNEKEETVEGKLTAVTMAVSVRSKNIGNKKMNCRTGMRRSGKGRIQIIKMEI